MDEVSKNISAIESALRKIFPIEGEKNQLELIGIERGSPQTAPDDPSALKDTKIRGESHGIKLYARVRLLDKKSGREVSRSRVLIGFLPVKTPHKTYLVDGTEYQVHRQQVLKPGIYNVPSSDGFRTEVRLEDGNALFITFSPSSKVFSVEYSGKKIPLISLLRRLGVSDDTIIRSWGKDIFNANVSKDVSPQKVVSFLQRAFKLKAGSKLSDNPAIIQEIFKENAKIDPEVTQKTLGKRIKSVDGTALLAASSKLLSLYRSEDEPDDVTQLYFKEFRDVSDYIARRILASRHQIVSRTKRRIDRAEKASDAIDALTIRQAITGTFTGSDLSSAVETTNPLDLISEETSVTLKGEYGGKRNKHAITVDFKDVTPSSIGILDPVKTSQGEPGVNLHMTINSKVKDGKAYTRVYDLRKKKERDVSNEEYYDLVIAFPGEYKKNQYGQWVPKKGQIVASHRGKLITVHPSKVDALIPDPKGMFSLVTNMIPFLQNNSGPRAMFGSGQMTQAVALKEREPRLVQTAVNEKTTFDKVIGEELVPKSQWDGEVVKVTDTEIVIKDNKGKNHSVKIYDNYPLSRDNFLNHEPIVKVGDKVKKGQILADSNYTKNGNLAIGKNLTVALMPYKGHTYEDGIVITEAASKKLTSEHIRAKRIDLKDGIILDREMYYSQFPNKMTQQNYAKLDKNGVIRKGQKVEPGDILVSAIRKIDMRQFEVAIGTGALKGVRYAPAELKWDYDFPGVVQDVGITKNRVIVYVKTEEPAKVGDKLCLTPDHDVLTNRGWVPIDKISPSDKVCTLDRETYEIKYDDIEALHKYENDGDKLYLIETEHISQMTTLEHKFFAGLSYVDGGVEWGMYSAKELQGAPYMMVRGGMWQKEEEDSPLNDYRVLELLAAYLSRGEVIEKNDNIGVVIRINLDDADRFSINSSLVSTIIGLDSSYVQSRSYVEFSVSELNFLAKEQPYRIPGAVFDLPTDKASFLMRAMCKYSGEASPGMNYKFVTEHKELADDFQRLVLHSTAFSTMREIAVGDKVKYEVLVDFNMFVKVNEDMDNPDDKLVDYEGSVYCLTVPTHIFCVRRNGKVSWTGNSDSHGAKGVITKIIPDDAAPYRKRDGKPVDVFYDPHGVPSRMNIGQIYEMAAGKIAEKTGKPYVVQNFEDVDYREKIGEELKKAGVPDKETLYDPETGKEIPGINVGPKYIYKLKHQVDKKTGIRTPDGPYNMDEQPIKGKKMDRLTTYALLAHGAKENLREMRTIKASNPVDRQNRRYWDVLRSGGTWDEPLQPTFAYNKFISMVKGMGINVKREGNELKIMPMLDKDVLEMSNGEIKRPDAVRGKNFKPVEGGLFTAGVTGGIDARKGESSWSHITLPKRFPNPVFEGAVSSLLGLRQGDIPKIINGEKSLDGKTGPEAIEEALKKIDVEKELETSLQEAKKILENKKKQGKASYTTISRLNRKIGYLKALKQLGMKPDEAYMMRYVPVLPPNMRPIVDVGTGTKVVNELNLVYHNILTSKMGSEMAITPETKREAEKQIYDSLENLTNRTASKPGYKGLMATIAGKTPKEGYYQKKVLYSPQELSARLVITNDPTLPVDQVGLPEDVAWKLFEPFVMSNMVRKGYRITDAFEKIKNREMDAKQELYNIAKERPILINRAPSWHRFNIMAFKPYIIDSKSMRVPNLVVNSYFGGDFDGDQMQVHVPITDRAVQEAFKMTPDKYLLKPGSGSLMMAPEASAIIGLNYLSTLGKKTNKKFSTEEEAISAERKGKIKVNDVISVGGKRTTVGRIMINRELPKDMPIQEEINKSTLKRYLKELSEKYPKEYPSIVKELNVLGDTYSTYAGFSIGVSDLPKIDNEVKPMINAKLRAMKNENIFKDSTKQRKFVQDMIKLQGELEKKVPRLVDPKKNAFGKMMNISGKGNPGQIRQVLAAGMLYENAKGGVVPVPVTDSYAKGLSPANYFIQQIGSRKGIIDRSTMTAKPGEVGKELLATNLDRVVTMRDCGTQRGIKVNIKKNPDWAEDHTLLKQYNGYSRNTVVTGTVIADLLAKKFEEIEVRSPLRCEAPNGVCQMCYGVNEKGQFPEIGENVGIQDSQVIIERSANFTLKAWHTSGAREEGISGAFDKYNMIVHMPENPKNRATVAEVDGKVESIKDNPGGGKIVTINGEKHMVSPFVTLKPEIVPGAVVKKGDPLTTGWVRPQDILQYKGVEAAQDKLTNDLHGLMQQFGIKRKVVENVIGGMTTVARVEDPGDSDYVPWDYTSVNKILEFNKNLVQEVPVEQAIGYKLAEDYGGFKKGDEVDNSMMISLKAKGIHRVKIEKKPIKFEPVLKSLKSVPLYKDNDWLTRMNYQKIKDTLQEGAARAYSSNIHGYSPIPGLAYGAEFGMGDPNKPGSY